MHSRDERENAFHSAYVIICDPIATSIFDLLTSTSNKFIFVSNFIKVANLVKLVELVKFPRAVYKIPC